jgi:hypothetical protein
MPGYGQPPFGYTWAAQHSPQQAADGAHSPVPHGLAYPSQNHSPSNLHSIQGQYHVITQPGVPYPSHNQFGQLISQPSEFIKTEEIDEIDHNQPQIHYQHVVQPGQDGMIYQPLSHYYITDQQSAPQEEPNMGTPQNVENYENHNSVEIPQHSPSVIGEHNSPENHYAAEYKTAGSPDFHSNNNANLSSSSEYASVSSEMQSI